MDDAPGCRTPKLFLAHYGYWTRLYGNSLESSGVHLPGDLFANAGQQIDQATVRSVLNSWGPGKFDAELFLDGKAANPRQITDGVPTGTNVPGTTLIPPAFGLGGVNLHTWTGWGSIPHWNAFVANLEMHGQGRFWDPRLNDPGQFPIASANGFGDLKVNGQHISPDDDMITSKLQALQFYQLAIPSPEASRRQLRSGRGGPRRRAVQW